MHIHFVESPVTLRAEGEGTSTVVLDHVAGAHPAPEPLAGQYRAALLTALDRLRVHQLGPPHIRRVVLHAHSLEAVRACGHAIDLMHREVLGGLVPEITCCPLGNSRTPLLSVSLTAAADAATAAEEPVYLGYLPAELNRLYGARTAVPDHPAIFQRWREASACLEMTVDEVPYGEGPWERIDLMRADGDDAPLLIFIHGGYWQSMDKFEHRALLAGLVGEGIDVALVNYALCPDVTVATIVEQVRYACTVLLSSRAGDGSGTSPCMVAGHSVGAQLAAMMLATDWSAMHPALPPTPMVGAVLVSGVYDLLPLVPTTLNRPLGLTTEDAVRLSPLHRRPLGAPRLFVAWGGAESAEFRRQSLLFADTWRAHGAVVDTEELPGAHHFGAMESLGDPEAFPYRAVVRTLRS